MNETNTMFCFQCEQTAGCSGCTGTAGACGKQAGTARLQDEVTGALVGLALTVRAAGTSGDARRAADDLAMEGLFATLTNVDFDDAELRGLVARVHAERDAIAMAARVEAAPDYDLAALWNAPEDVRSLKSLVLFGLRGLAAYAYHAAALGYRDDAVSSFLHEGLAALADAEAGADVLLPLSLKVGEVNLRCMELLDQANTETFGTPEPTAVARAIEAGPFVVVSGHDLHDLKLLLDQTQGRARLPRAEALRPPQRQPGNRVAEPARRVRRPARTHPVHHELPHAAGGLLRRPRVHHRSCGVPRHDAR